MNLHYINYIIYILIKFININNLDININMKLNFIFYIIFYFCINKYKFYIYIS